MNRPSFTGWEYLLGCAATAVLTFFVVRCFG